MYDSERERNEIQQQGPPGMPAWVKISAAVVAVLVVAVIAVLLVSGGGGEHGPSRHGAEGAVATDVTRSALSAGALG